MATATARLGNRRNGRANGGGSYNLVDDLLAMAGSLASSRKNFASAKLETLAGAVRECTSAMPDIPHVKAYASAAAESLDGLADYVMESDLATMVADAREFARRHPVATLTGTIAAGVVISQMMQSRAAPELTASSRRTSAARQSRADA